MPDPEDIPEDEEDTEPLEGILTEPAAQGQLAFATDPALALPVPIAPALAAAEAEAFAIAAASALPIEPEDEPDEPMLPDDDPPT